MHIKVKKSIKYSWALNIAVEYVTLINHFIIIFAS